MAPSKLTPQEQKVILHKHNTLRGSVQPSGADEIRLEWDDRLAARAQAWANKCTFKHDFLTDCKGNYMGQNLYTAFAAHNVPDVDPQEVVQEWYNEQPFYQYSSNTCQAGKVCGHYTQVVWAKTRLVGCGIAACKTLFNPGYKNHTNAALVVCNYDPPGNYIGARPYTSGSSCSQCKVKDGGFKCENNLCVPCIPKLDPACECPVSECANGGVVNMDTCECSCPDGFYGQDCSLGCKDKSTFCSHWKGYCGQAAYKGFMKSNCAKTCGLC
ncbi:GLIPR1-like protein 1 [Liolophura sinensis]|uniref:GLIPR1-like protein 1 n=1 Tax=Liolophura sinensis TaxID=3198878 RepID=UPI0031590207